MEYLTRLYNKLSENQKRWLASSLHTFIATAGTIVVATIQGDIQWNSAFWTGLVVTSIRAGLKAVFEASPFPLLGGKK